jgi:hypothetical protein
VAAARLTCERNPGQPAKAQLTTKREHLTSQNSKTDQRPRRSDTHV